MRVLQRCGFEESHVRIVSAPQIFAIYTSDEDCNYSGQTWCLWLYIKRMTRRPVTWYHWKNHYARRYYTLKTYIHNDDAITKD